MRRLCEVLAAKTSRQRRCGAAAAEHSGEPSFFGAIFSETALNTMPSMEGHRFEQKHDDQKEGQTQDIEEEVRSIQ